ncbi:MAG TPA: histidine phosphatase family protein, partial [Polyangiales bacterium]
ELCVLAERHRLVLHPVIDCSPLLRAYQTACIAAEVLAAETRKPFRVEQHAALCERSLGAAANLTVAQIDQILARDSRYGRPPPHWRYLPTFELPFPGAESLMSAGKRVAEHLRNTALALASKSRAETLKLCVGHGGALRYAACELGVLELARAPQLSMQHGRPVLIERLTAGSWTHLDGSWEERSPIAKVAADVAV